MLIKQGKKGEQMVRRNFTLEQIIKRFKELGLDRWAEYRRKLYIWQ